MSKDITRLYFDQIYIFIVFSEMEVESDSDEEENEANNMQESNEITGKFLFSKCAFFVKFVF